MILQRAFGIPILRKGKDTMKKTALLVLMLVSCMTVPALAGSASKKLIVQATVLANCTVSAAPLNFGTYNPLVTHAATALVASQALTLKCTKGTVATSVDLDNGANFSGGTRRMRSGATGHYLTYQLRKEVAHTHVRAAGATNRVMSDASTSNNRALTISGTALTVFGRIPQNQGVTMGSYSDTVSMTINF